MEQSLLIRVRIRYELGEFAGFVRKRTAMRSRQRGRQGLIQQVAQLSRLALMPLEYIGQLVQHGPIHLHIDQGGMRWRTRDGVVCQVWEDVEGVDRTGDGFVILTLDGCWFLPDRVLSSSQKAQLSDLFSQRIARPSDAGAGGGAVVPKV